MDDRSDKSLVLASCNADRGAYAALTRRHYQSVFLLCMGLLGNVHDAEDVAQDTLLRGFERIRTLRDGAQFGRWISRIARNLCMNRLRRFKFDRKAVEARLAEQSEERTTVTPDLEQAIERLPREIRLPLVMYYFDGRSVKSVAEKMSISTSGVYAKLRTAIMELHTLMVEQGDR